MEEKIITKGKTSTSQSWKCLNQLLSQDECEQILSDLPTPDYEAAPAINRFQVQVPLNTWYKMEKVPIRIELIASEFITSKLAERLNKDFTVFDNRMYVTKYTENQYCAPHVDPSEYTAIIQLNNEYSGGEFTLNNTPIEMSIGDALVFPNANYLHGVKKIKQGTRSSLALWLNYNKETYLH